LSRIFVEDTMTDVPAGGAGDLVALVERLQEQTSALAENQRRLREIAATASSRRRLVTVSAGHGGVIQKVTFDGDGYKRLTPVELASQVQETIRAAQDKACEEAAHIVAPSLPPGVDAQRMMRGEVDLAELIPQRSLVDRAVDRAVDRVAAGAAVAGTTGV
jgi:DNA-binding protein YbaB